MDTVLSKNLTSFIQSFTNMDLGALKELQILWHFGSIIKPSDTSNSISSYSNFLYSSFFYSSRSDEHSDSTHEVPTLVAHSKEVELVMYNNTRSSRLANDSNKNDDGDVKNVIINDEAVMRRVFDTLDEDNDGRITRKDLSKILLNLGIMSIPHQYSTESTTSTCRTWEPQDDDTTLFSMDSHVSWPQFLALYKLAITAGSNDPMTLPPPSMSHVSPDEVSASSLCIQGMRISEEEDDDDDDDGDEMGENDDDQLMVGAFQVFDKDGDGLISPMELLDVLHRLGHFHVDAHDCANMIARVDLNGDGHVNFSEFKSLFGL